MDKYDLCIATANIHFSNIYWYQKHYCYAFDITFEKASYPQLNDLVSITAGADEDSAKDYLDAVKQYFTTAGIHEGSDVVVLFSGTQVLAISARGNDLWIDLQKGVFHYVSPKRFCNLGINVNSLEVY